jgi:hypothetical protein
LGKALQVIDKEVLGPFRSSLVSVFYLVNNFQQQLGRFVERPGDLNPIWKLLPKIVLYHSWPDFGCPNHNISEPYVVFGKVWHTSSNPY